MDILKFLQLLHKATNDNRHYFRLEESNDHLELIVYNLRLHDAYGNEAGFFTSGTKWRSYRIDEGDMNKTPEALVQEVLEASKK